MNDILDVLVETFTLDGPVRRFTHIRFCKLNTCITNVLTNRFPPFRSLLLYRLATAHFLSYCILAYCGKASGPSKTSLDVIQIVRRKSARID